MNSQNVCTIRCLVTTNAFEWLFSTVHFQMCPQVACLRRCKVTLVAFVWLVSTVYYHISSENVCISFHIILKFNSKYIFWKRFWVLMNLPGSHDSFYVTFQLFLFEKLKVTQITFEILCSNGKNTCAPSDCLPKTKMTQKYNTVLLHMRAEVVALWKYKWQKKQLQGFPPVWWNMWLFWAFVWVNNVLQKSQYHVRNCFNPLSQNLWIFKTVALVKY